MVHIKQKQKKPHNFIQDLSYMLWLISQDPKFMAIYIYIVVGPIPPFFSFTELR
jgi:hypothetical protein